MTSAVGTADSLVGQYGDLPYDMYLRKIEQTCGYENPHLVEENLRNLLRDFTPDAPYLESDQPRGGHDEFGNERGGYESEQRINLRSGARTLIDPYLPDGTFLDHQFTERDPRGVALGPDMRRHVDQQYARKDLIKYFPDNDDSIPETGWNPWQAQMQIRNAQNVTKDYFKVFETSKDSWHNGGMAPGYSVSNKEKLIEGQEIKDPTHAPNINKIDVTNNLSNDTSIGWRRTTDHRFQVAKYGKTNTKKSFTTEDWYKNRSNAHTDHDIYVSWQGSNMLKGTALKMMDLAKRKEMYQFTGLNGIVFGNSTHIKNKQQKLTPADMAGVISRQTKETRSVDAHAELNGDQKPTSGKKLMIHDVKNIEKTIINQEIADKISSVNKRMTKTKKNDLRKDIQKSVDENGVYISIGNKKKGPSEVDPKAMWNSIAVYKKGDSLNVKNYKAASSKIEEGGKKLERVVIDDDFKESYVGNQRRGELTVAKNQNVNTSQIDNDYGREVERSHMVGPLGSKYMTSHMECDTDQNDINDTDRRCGI